MFLLSKGTGTSASCSLNTPLPRCNEFLKANLIEFIHPLFVR